MKYLVVIDPIKHLDPKHDTTIAMMQAMQDCGHEVWICETTHMGIHSGNGIAQATQLTVQLNQTPWYHVISYATLALDTFDIIIMRKDPPFDMDYIFATYILDTAIAKGVLVANHPTSLRNFNEKLLLNHFPELTTDYIVSSNLEQLNQFILKHQDIVVKPLDSMGGESIYRLSASENNEQRLMEMTQQQQRFIMAMEYIPEVTIGDKRILLIHGQPVSHALRRVPPEGQLQANIAAGGTGVVVPLNKRDYHIAESISDFCLQHGLYFVGIDVIGEYVTEINITSPTCLREIENHTQDNLAMQFIQGLDEQANH